MAFKPFHFVLFKQDKIQNALIIFRGLQNIAFRVGSDFNPSPYVGLQGEALVNALKKANIKPSVRFWMNGRELMVSDWDVETSLQNTLTNQGNKLLSNGQVSELLVGGFISPDVAVGEAAYRMALKALRPIDDVYDAVDASFKSLSKASLDTSHLLEAFHGSDDKGDSPALPATQSIIILWDNITWDEMPALFNTHSPSLKELNNLVKRLNREFPGTDFAFARKSTLQEKRQQFLNALLDMLTGSNTIDAVTV